MNTELYIFQKYNMALFFFKQKALIQILWSVVWASRHMIPINVNDPHWL